MQEGTHEGTRTMFGRAPEQYKPLFSAPPSLRLSMPARLCTLSLPNGESQATETLAGQNQDKRYLL